MTFRRSLTIFIISMLACILPATSAFAGTVSRWAQSTGYAPTDKARLWVANQAGMRANIERGNAWALGDFASGTASYTTLKNQGVVGVRLFFPWRYTVDMAGYGAGNPPSDSQLGAFLDSATNAMKAGLYVQIDMMDVVGTEDTSQAADGGVTTERHLNHFSDLIAARMPQWDLTKIAIGTVNEWAGGDNATYNAVRIKYHNMVRAKLGPNVIMVINPSYWGDPSALDNNFQLPSDGGPLMVQIHSYLGMGDATNSAAWANIQRNALAWSDSHGGVPVTFGEAALGDWSANAGAVLSDPNNHLKVIIPLAQGAPELRPAYWTITRPGAYFYINYADGTLLTSPDLAGAFRNATASIRAVADAPAGGTTSSATTLATTGTTTLNVRNASAVSGFSADANGAAFNWGFMAGSGAYVEYTLNVTQAQSFNLVLGTATPGASTADISINGVRATALSVPATGGWGSYVNTAPVALNLPQGSAVKLRITATSSQAFNLAGVSLQANALTSTTTVQPSGTTAINVKTASAVNGFSADANGVAFNWGFMSSAGAFTEYTLNVTQAQSYQLVLNTATPAASSVDVLVNGVKAAAATLPASGGWGTYANTAPVTLNLPQGGAVKLRITATSSQAFNLAGISLQAVSVSKTSTIIGLGTNKCLDVPGGQTTSGISLVEWSCNGNAWQKFRFVPLAGGYYNIKPESNLTLCLDPNSTSGNDVDVKQLTCNGSNAQRWTLTRESSGAYLIKTNDGRCMDIYGNSTNDGTRIETWACDASQSERFKLMF
ncbi:hypothetical protein BH11PSE11_BH11PSE11_35440 [soil metagenome]